LRLGLVLSSEHGGNRVPARYRPDFVGAEKALASHAGWDPGSATLARELQRTLGAALIQAKVTRLLVELNRSLHHPQLFSRWVRHHTPDERELILERYWRTHRSAVEAAVRAAPEPTVLHVAVHSFTPRWKGRERSVDVGLLFDPGREREAACATRWIRALAAERPDLLIRRNRPYLGTSDGLTTHLRGVFPASRYLGIELEVSQRFPLGPAPAWRELIRALRRSLQASLSE